MRLIKGIFDVITPEFPAGCHTPYLRIAFLPAYFKVGTIIIVPTKPENVHSVEVADDGPGKMPSSHLWGLTPTAFPMTIDTRDFGPDFDFRFCLNCKGASAFKMRIHPHDAEVAPP